MPAAGDPIYASDFAYFMYPPRVRLLQAATQNLPNATNTAITFGAGSEEYDTHGFHDTGSNTTRITPNVPGYYRIAGGLYVASQTTTLNWGVFIAKNGAAVPSRSQDNTATSGGTSFAGSKALTATATLTADGVSDYFELFGAQNQATGTANLSTVVSGSQTSFFEVEYAGPLVES